MPGLQLLVTSRRALGLGVERVVQVPPLGVDDAAALFAARARARGMEVDPEAAATLVDALEHLPLAIELAASRAPMLGVDELQRRLTRPLDVLRASRADLPERHRSLRGALEQSWAALDRWEQALLVRSSFLRGGFGIALAEEVLAGPEWQGPPVLDVVQSLLEHSLLRRLDVPGPPRFAPYLAVRSYAAEQPPDEPLVRVRQRHLAWCAALGGARGLAEPPPAAYPRLIPELPDAVAAVSWALRSGRRMAAARLVAVLVPVLARRGYVRRAASLLDRIRPLDDLPPDLEMALCYVDGVYSARADSRREAAAGLSRAAELAAEQGRVGLQARSLGGLALSLTQMGRSEEAEAALVRAEALLPEVGPGAEAVVVRARAWSHFRKGEVDDAWQGLQLALGLTRSYGTGWMQVAIYTELAGIAQATGSLAEAETFVQHGLAVCEPAGAEQETRSLRDTLGLVWQDQGRLHDARELFRGQLATARRIGSRGQQRSACNRVATLDALLGDIDGARTSFSEALAIAEELEDDASAAAAMFNLGELELRAGFPERGREVAGAGAGALPGHGSQRPHGHRAREPGHHPGQPWRRRRRAVPARGVGGAAHRGPRPALRRRGPGPARRGGVPRRSGGGAGHGHRGGHDAPHGLPRRGPGPRAVPAGAWWPSVTGTPPRHAGTSRRPRPSVTAPTPRASSPIWHGSGALSTSPRCD